MPKPTKSPSKWITTAAMAQELGVTAQTLRRHRFDYQEGNHYYQVNPGSSRPTYRWNKKRMLRKCGISIT
jgi:hypothetical protein